MAKLGWRGGSMLTRQAKARAKAALLALSREKQDELDGRRAQLMTAYNNMRARFHATRAMLENTSLGDLEKVALVLQLWQDCIALANVRDDLSNLLEEYTSFVKLSQDALETLA